MLIYWETFTHRNLGVCALVTESKHEGSPRQQHWSSLQEVLSKRAKNCTCDNYTWPQWDNIWCTFDLLTKGRITFSSIARECHWADSWNSKPNALGLVWFSSIHQNLEQRDLIEMYKILIVLDKEDVRKMFPIKNVEIFTRFASC